MLGMAMLSCTIPCTPFSGPAINGTSGLLWLFHMSKSLSPNVSVSSSVDRGDITSIDACKQLLQCAGLNLTHITQVYDSLKVAGVVCVQTLALAALGLTAVFAVFALFCCPACCLPHMGCTSLPLSSPTPTPRTGPCQRQPPP